MFWLWLRIGVQSFGGGVATQFLMRKTFVEQQASLSDEQFTRFFAICQIAPGINLAALTILIGRHLGGWRGILAALTGLFLPSSVITVIMTALYALVKDLPVVQAALRGIAPAVVALGFILCAKLARTVLFASPLKQAFPWPFGCALMALCAVLLFWLKMPVFAIYALAGICSALATVLWRRGNAA